MLYRPEYSDRKALIIGINDYTHVSPLHFACNDANSISELLVTDFGFPKENVILLKDKEALKDKIIKAFHGFTETKTNPDDKLLIFFAGHGHTIHGNRGEVGFLVPVDGKPNDTSTMIRWDELTRTAEIIKAKHILFIMDACYGGLAITRAPAVGSKRFLKNMCQRYSRQVITAGKADESVADAGGPLPDHSIFTGHLLNGLKGAAATDEEIITANCIMAYVYEKVGNDPHSHQTPHYGYVEGDGDFIFTEEPLKDISKETKKDEDILIEVSSAYIDEPEQKTFSQKIKESISDPSKRVYLHDMAMQEVRTYLQLASKDKLPLQTNVTNELIVERYKRYEDITCNIQHFFIVLPYWGDVEHVTLLEKILKRITDGNGAESGKTVFLNMRWYPACLLLYLSGISCLAAENYTTLAQILLTKVHCKLNLEEPRQIVFQTLDPMVELHKTFKLFPGHEKNLVPRSEYLFKLLQPQLDETLFLGESYEELFDRFEMLIALVYADVLGTGWGVPGRFGYKHSRGRNKLFINFLEEAERRQDDWPPIKAGFFKRSYSHFKEVSDSVLNQMNRMSWF